VTVFYWVVKAILGPFLALLFRPWAEGTENVPREGAAILASNHLSFSDHFFGPLPLPRKVTFLAKSEYFTGRGLKGLVSKAFFSGVGQIPVDRSGGKASERALATGLRVLSAGKLLGIYPEGTRSPDGRLYRGHTGVARRDLRLRPRRRLGAVRPAGRCSRSPLWCWTLSGAGRCPPRTAVISPRYRPIFCQQRLRCRSKKL
jgi:1-acyl-sn-glycerol-3-phosphate acyltransferase